MARRTVYRASGVGSTMAPLLVLSSALACSVAAQTPPTPAWATLRQQVDIDMGAGDGSADVEVRLELGPPEPGAGLPLDAAIALELLGFGDATVDEVVLGRPGAPTAERRIVLWPTTGSHRIAVVEPPFDAPASATEREVLTVLLSYRLEDVLEADGGAAGSASADDASIHARVPMLTGPPVRAEGGGEAFRARLAVPEGWALSEGFPSGLRGGGVGDEGGVYTVGLAVAPAVVGFRASTDGRWRPGLPLLVDVLTLVGLAIFAGFGWRHLRGVAREAGR